MQTKPLKEKSIEMEFTGERFVPGKPELTYLYQEHMSRYMFATQFVQGKRVLDLGCGCGYGSYYLAKNGATEVVGIDNSEEAVDFSRSRYNSENLHFEVQDATALRFDSCSFDVVLAFELIEHLREYEKMLSEAKRVLRRGGVFVISTPNKATYETKDEFHVKEFYYDELKDVLDKYFSWVKIMHQMYPSALSIQNPSQTDDILQVETARTPIYAEPSKYSLYFVAVCSDIPVPEIKEYIYLFKSRTLLIDNYDAWKSWIKQLQRDMQVRDARIMELQTRITSIERSRLYQAYSKARRVVAKIKRHA